MEVNQKEKKTFSRYKDFKPFSHNFYIERLNIMSIKSVQH